MNHRWLFADVYHLRHLLELSGKVNGDVNEFLREVNLDTLVRIPDSYSEVEETGEADLAFRVNVASGAPVLVGILVEHKSGRDTDTEAVLREKGLSEELIAEIRAEIEAKRQARESRS